MVHYMPFANKCKSSIERYLPLLLVILLIIGLPFFFFGGPGYRGSRSFIALWNLGHILFFSLFTLLVIVWNKRRGIHTTNLRFFALLFGTVFLLGLVIEVVQVMLKYRTGSVNDIYLNQLGCLLTFSLVGLGIGRLRQNLVRAGVFLLIIFSALPLAQALYDENMAVRQFPVLSDFETRFEQTRWRDVRQIRQQSEVVRHGRYGLRVQLSTATYSGINIFYFPGDWRGYKTLNFSVYNPDNEEFTLHVRIHDRRHERQGMKFPDRFHQRLTLHYGWNDFAISLQTVLNAPESRQINMAEIAGFGIFVIRQTRARIIYLDHVYLCDR